MGSGIFDAVWSTATVIGGCVPSTMYGITDQLSGTPEYQYNEHKKKGVLSQCMDPYTFCNYVEY